jgi:hypothetical protein
VKVLSEIRKENEKWLFDYLADSDPRDELHQVGAFFVERQGGDAGPSSGQPNGQYHGSAYALPNTATALTVVQARLLGWDWSLRPRIDQ